MTKLKRYNPTGNYEPQIGLFFESIVDLLPTGPMATFTPLSLPPYIKKFFFFLIRGWGEGDGGVFRQWATGS